MRCVRGGDLGVRRYALVAWWEEGGGQTFSQQTSWSPAQAAGGGGRCLCTGGHGSPSPVPNSHSPHPTPPLLVSVCVCGFSSTYLCGEGGSRGDRDPGDPSDLSDLGVVVGLHHHSRSTPPPRGGSPLVADLHGPCAPRRRRCLLHHHLDLVLYFDLNSPRPVVSTRTCLDT